jgi:hypothetical protein
MMHPRLKNGKLFPVPTISVAIIIFTNRLEDGILHGATPATKIRKNKKASRPLYHVSIRYQETEKSPRFL